MRHCFVVLSKDDKFQMGIDELSFENTTVYQVPNNKETIAKVYNSYLKLIRTEKDRYDFIVFMHADVKLDVKHLMQHIESCNDKYDVFGLCGTSIFNISQSPLNWWTASNPTPQAKWGCVTHGELGNKMSFFSQDRGDVLDHEVACIDGLCIIFGRKAIDSDMYFDEQFAFDFYDSDISLLTILDYKLKLGVIVEKSLQHYSVGRSILTEDFLRHEVDFRKKWKFDIPENSPIRKLNLS